MLSLFFYWSWQDSLRSCSTSETSSNLNARRRSRSSFSNQSRDVRESSFDENDEYAYAENNRSSKYSSAYQVSVESSFRARIIDGIFFHNHFFNGKVVAGNSGRSWVKRLFHIVSTFISHYYNLIFYFRKHLQFLTDTVHLPPQMLTAALQKGIRYSCLLLFHFNWKFDLNKKGRK